MRRVVLGALAAALVFTIGCAEPDTDGDDTASQPDAAAAVDGSPGYAATTDPPDPVPLTITMPSKRTDDDKKNDPGNDFIGRVAFPDYPRSDGEPYIREDVRTQYLVGKVPIEDGQVSFSIETFKGASGNSDKGASKPGEIAALHFAAEASCAPENEGEDIIRQGHIARIACAAGAPGRDGTPPFRLVCSAIYNYYDDPPPTCEGTYACVKCRSGVRVCSENPQCVD